MVLYIFVHCQLNFNYFTDINSYQGCGLQSSTSVREKQREKTWQLEKNLPLKMLMWHKSKAPSVLHDISTDSHVLCVQVGPSQPSLQMHLKASAPPTHVPPFSQGPESHVLFWAKRKKRKRFLGMLLFWRVHRRKAAPDRESVFSQQSERASDLCCRCCPPSLRGSCTGRSLRGRNTCLRYCRWSGHTDSHLNPGNTTSVFKQRSGPIHFTKTAKTS